MPPVRFGILSTARINARVLAGIAASPDAEAVAVASRDGERARAYAADRGIPRAHAGYDALLADPDVEAVYISLPNRGHVEWALRAVAAGKHVLVEKPLTRRAAEAEQLFDAASAAGVLVSEAFMYRHHPQMALLRGLLDDGAVGDLHVVRGHFSFRLEDDGDPRWSAAEDGGALMDVGVYPLSAARAVAGEPERVYAEAVAHTGGVDARLAAVLRHPGGVITHLDCGLDEEFRCALEVIGPLGSILLRDPYLCGNPSLEVRRGGAVEMIPVEKADPYRLEVEDLCRAIRGGGEPLLGRADAVGQARAVEALYESIEQGRPVDLAG